MPDFNIPLQKLSVHLDEVVAITNLNELSKRLKSNLNGIVNWDILDAPKKKLVKDYSSIPSIHDQVLINSLFVSTIASFESFLRELIIEVLKKIEGTGKISSDLVNKNIQLSGIAMASVFSPITHLKIDYNSVCRKIGTIPNSDTTELNYEIAYFVKNILQLENLFVFLKSCDIDIKWDDLGKVKKIQKILNTKQTRETTNALKFELKSYIEIRNRIAHTGMNSTDITYPELKDSIHLINILSEFLKKKCE